MGMNHLGEISSLAKIVKPNVAIITNVGTAHIGNLGSRENILKAKLEIIENFQENDTLIINNDNDLLHEWYLNNKEWIDKYHSAGKKVSCWTFSQYTTKEDLQKYIDMGVDFVTCDKLIPSDVDLSKRKIK